MGEYSQLGKTLEYQGYKHSRQLEYYLIYPEHSVLPLHCRPSLLIELGPLLKASTEEPGAPPEEDTRTRTERFIDAIKPFDIDDWREAKWYGRFYIVVKVINTSTASY